MSEMTLHKALSLVRNPWNRIGFPDEKRVAELWLCDQAEWLSANPVALTDAEIIEIRDNHLPSQGEAFDCIAFAREVIHCAGIRPRKREQT